MKKSELTQLTQVIEHLVAKEVKKQLPRLIGEVFANMAGRTVVAEHTPRKSAGAQPSEVIKENVEPEEQEDFKMSMRELFSGATPVGVRAEVERQPASPRHFTSNPILNQILNETTPDLRQRERMVGGAAFHGGYSPAVAMAASAMGGVQGMTPGMGVGEMMSEAELPSFARNLPTMPGVNPGAHVASPRINENAIPAASIPDGISALDVARQVPLAQPVAQALTKNYSQMMKLIDSKRKGKV